MRRKINKALQNLYLEDFVRSCFRKARYYRRKIDGTDKRLIKKYFRDHDIRKLQLGSGSNPLDGWMNSNFYPKSNRVVHVDATKRFPFPENSFDYIYNEHMFEHITLNAGISMLSECFRVLKPGGVLRLVTPDVQFLFDLYTDQKTKLQEEYIEANTKRFIPDAPFATDLVIINNFFKDWGHLFIYDQATLHRVLKEAGFRSIQHLGLNESGHPALEGLSNEGRYPPGFLVLESQVIEGTKPTH